MKLLGKEIKSKLKAENFTHLSQELNKSIKLLESATKSKQKGVNILLYGDVGCGKTEFANKANPFCAAFILSREKITNKTVKTQNTSGIKLRLNLKNITFILGKAIKSPDTVYCVNVFNMRNNLD